MPGIQSLAVALVAVIPYFLFPRSRARIVTYILAILGLLLLLLHLVLTGNIAQMPVWEESWPIGYVSSYGLWLGPFGQVFWGKSA